MNKLLLSILVMVVAVHLTAQTWKGANGQGGDGNWNTAAQLTGAFASADVAFQTLSSGTALHVEVFQKDGRFAAWPANGGMWVWGNEILVCYTEADHLGTTGHTYDSTTAWSMFARSLDGGQTWTREDAHAQGITASGHDHRVHQGVPLRTLIDPIDFKHPDFAMLFHRRHMHKGDSFFYYTYDRGKSWKGPFKLPLLDTIGLIARTDYIIDGQREATAFMTVTKSDGREGRVAPFRTKDGGVTWERIAWIGEELAGQNDFAIMPSTVRLDPKKLLTIIRHRVGGPQRADDRTWLTSFLSTDNGGTWEPLADPVSDNINNPPALIQLPDGRLVLTYIFRRRNANESAVCAKISSDGGQSWGPEIVLREKEGTSGDSGYPRIVRRSDGKLVITYYWNQALNPDVSPYRYIAATIWTPPPAPIPTSLNIDDSDGSIRIYPSVSSDKVYFKNLPENSRIIVLDMVGRSVLMKNAPELNDGLSLQPYPKGVYIIRIVQETETIHSTKVLKN
jgi:hypothetical protein